MKWSNQVVRNVNPKCGVTSRGSKEKEGLNELSVTTVKTPIILVIQLMEQVQCGNILGSCVVKVLLSQRVKWKIKVKKHCHFLCLNLSLGVVVLDPRYKIKFVRFCYGKLYDTKEEIDTATEKVLNKLKILFEEYKLSEVACSSGNENVNEMQIIVHTNMGVDEDIDDDHFRFDFQKRLKDDDQNAKSEMEKYLDENCEDDNSSFELLDWWKVASSKYPTLATIARDVFAILVSTVASESTFSTGGRILSDYRSSLTPKLVECLICTQDWMRGNLDIEWPTSLEELQEVESLAISEDKDIVERLAQVI